MTGAGPQRSQWIFCKGNSEILSFKVKGCLQLFPDWQLIQMDDFACHFLKWIKFFPLSKDKTLALGCPRRWCHKEESLIPVIVVKAC